MADVARTGLTLVGGYFFGPLGALAGGLIGNLIFPVQLPDVKGPRIKEMSIQRSTIGAALPIVYGTQKLAGNINWWSDLIEVKSETDQGGKGGGPSQTITNYEYYLDFSVIIADGEDGRPSKPQGIRRIWAYGDLIFDLTPQRDDESTEDYNARLATSNQTAAMMTIYPGDEDQLASPLIESYEGVGNVPAYRGYFRVEFEHFPLNKYGKVLPQLTFEIYTLGDVEDVDCSEYSVGHLEPWQYMIDGSVHDPRNPLNGHLYAQSAGGVNFATHSFSQAMADMNATLPWWASPGAAYVCGEIPQVGDSAYIRGWAQTSTPNHSQPCDAGDVGAPSLATDRVLVTMNLNTIRSDPLSCYENPFPGGYDPADGGCGGLWLDQGEWYNYRWYNAGDFSGFYVLGADNLAPHLAGVPPAAWDGRGDCLPPGMPTTNVWAAFDQEMSVRRWHAPDPCRYGTPVSNAPGYCLIDGVLTRTRAWTRVAGTFKSLRPYIDTGEGGVVTSYPVDPVLPSGHPDYNNQTFWEAAFAAALADPTIYPPMDPTWTYGVDYPTARFSHASNMSANTPVWQASCEGDSIATECVPMADIVADICDRAGLTAVDVSDLQSCVTGYTCNTRPGMTARDSIVPLRTYGLFDVCESVVAGVPSLKFIERGHAVADTLEDADLRAHEYGSEPGPPVEVVRTQEKDLPRRVVVQYLDVDRDHEPNAQPASRLATEATSELVVSLAISMEAEAAAQLADVILSEMYASRNAYRFSLDNSHLLREPADCVALPVDGELTRARITAITYRLGGILQVEAVGDDAEIYDSTAAAIPTPGSGNPNNTGDLVVCPSELILLDLPGLRTSDVDCGVYGAIRGLCASWQCAAVYRSNDGGVTYGRVARTERQSTIGTIDSLTGTPTAPSDPDASSPDYDLYNEITVTLDTIGAELSSTSDDLILAGYNAAAIGGDGRWTIIQFKNATPVSGGAYVLSGLLWGMNDTEGNLGTTVAGDRFVLLNDAALGDTALVRIPGPVSDLGQLKYYKVVTCGESVDDVTPQTFDSQCLSYVPPVTGGGGIIVDDDNVVSIDPDALLDNQARVGVRVNSADPTYVRRRLNFLPVAGLNITIADDELDEEVDIAIELAGGGGAGGSFLLTGGGVAWIQDLDFIVGAATYVIQGVEYSSPQTDVTLDPADPTDPRIDVIAVDVNGDVVVITGTPAASPEKPDVDPETQLEISFVYVPAAATEPVVTTYVVYRENAEWTTSRNGTTNTLASTNNPYQGTKDVEGTSVATNHYVQFVAPSPFDPNTRDNLVFHIRSKATWPSTRSLVLTLGKNNSQRGTAVTFKHGTFGFDSSNVSTYQQIVIPVALFVAGGLSDTNRLRFTCAGTGTNLGYYLDNIEFQSGLLPDTSSDRMRWRGPYDAATAYARNDTVLSGGIQYVALAGSTNQTPATSPAYWQASTAAGGGGQAGIQFKDEGSNLGTSGTATSFDVVGAGAALTRVGDAVTLTVSGSGGGGGYPPALGYSRF